MLLVVDVGNSNTVIGAFAGATVAHQWRISTVQRTADELGVLLLQLLGHARLGPGDVEGVAVCSVVPTVVPGLGAACRRYLGRDIHVLDHTSDLGFPIRLANPAEVGPDRIVNAVAARRRLAPPFLIVDFGTATTFDCVDASGAFVGGAIAPGLQIAAEALFARTARLGRVDIARPPHAIGTNTREAMQSGIFWGYVGLVDGLARRCKEELGGRVACVATGGLAALVGGACREIDEVDEHLTLHGLRLWFEGGAR